MKEEGCDARNWMDIALIGRIIVALKEFFHELEKEGKQYD